LLPVPDNSTPAAEVKEIPARILCYVTDRNKMSPDEGGADLSVLEKVRGAIEARVNWVQIREKDLPTRALLALVQQAVDATRGQNDIKRVPGSRFHPAQTKVIVNERLDVALAASAAGVHLSRESASSREVVRWCRDGNAPRDFLIGASCHTLAEAREAESSGVSYLIFGPVFDTPSKRAFGKPVGIAELSAVCATVKIPVLAIGGVDVRNAHECFQAGAAGIAAIRMFQDADDLDELRHAVDSLRCNSKKSATR
jgi:thiamine-phosphate pyrophosphorylase